MPKRRRTLDRRKASAIITKPAFRTPDYPADNREQRSQLRAACDHTTTIVALVRLKVPRAIHVPVHQSFPIKGASLDRRPYQVDTACQQLPHPSARIRAFRRLHLNLAGRGLQPLSCPSRRPGSTPISRITPPSLY
jgi:hypothetical protein